MSKTEQRRCLVVRNPHTDFSWSRFGHVDGFISHINPKVGTECPFETGYGDDATDIEFSMQCSVDSPRWYGMEFYATGYRRMTLYQMEKCIAAMKPIGRQMDKMYSAYGPALNPGQWVARLAIAAKCKGIVTYCGPEVTHSKWRLWHPGSFSTAISIVNQQADLILAEVIGKQEEKAA